MKVSELIEALKELDQEAPVIMSSDAEGNDFHRFGGIDQELTTEDNLSMWSMEAPYPIDVLGDPKEAGEYDLEPEDLKNLVPVVCIWPA